MALWAIFGVSHVFRHNYRSRDARKALIPSFMAPDLAWHIPGGHMICGHQAHPSPFWPENGHFAPFFFKRVCLMGTHTFRRVARPKRAGGVHNVCQNKFKLPTTLQSQDFAFWSQKNSSIFRPPPRNKTGVSFKGMPFEKRLFGSLFWESITFDWQRVRSWYWYFIWFLVF